MLEQTIKFCAMLYAICLLMVPQVFASATTQQCLIFSSGETCRITLTTQDTFFFEDWSAEVKCYDSSVKITYINTCSSFSRQDILEQGGTLPKNHFEWLCEIHLEPEPKRTSRTRDVQLVISQNPNEPAIRYGSLFFGQYPDSRYPSYGPCELHPTEE